MRLLAIEPNVRYSLTHAPRTVSDHDLVDRLATLFRSVGFDGASLADIAVATGLQKASLYHRFPGGKQQMAAEVVGAVGEQFASSILAPLASDRPAAERVELVGRRLRDVYDGGTRSCVLDMLSIGTPGDSASEALAAAATGWITAFAAAARESGADARIATARAQDAVASIEGALVLARVTGGRRPFARAIDRLPSVLLGDLRGAPPWNISAPSRSGPHHRTISAGAARTTATAR